MPRGKKGCFVCGAPTEGVLQVQKRVYASGLRRDNYSRTMHAAETKSLSLCEVHLAEAYDRILAAFPRPTATESRTDQVKTRKGKKKDAQKK